MESQKDILQINNIENTINSLTDFIKDYTIKKFRKKGVVIGISGGIDSAVTTALSVKALGPENVLGLIMPEKDSSEDSKEFAKLLVNKLEIKSKVLNITENLESYGVYNIREEIVKRKFPRYDKNCQYRVAIPNNFFEEGVRIPFLEVLEKNGNTNKIKLSYNDYLTLTAATSIKHRVRMTLEYFYAEKLNYLVMGSTNKSEWIQGYFVKYGDGGVDLEPLAELFKTQIYQIAKFLDIPTEIINRKASPDTWSYQISDEEFFFGIPYKIMDTIWYSKENNIPVSEISKIINLDESQINEISSHMEKKSNSSEPMRNIPPSWKFNMSE